MDDRIDLSVIIVNWRSGDMTRALLDNLREQRFTADDGTDGTLEFIVLDNASGADEDAHLAALEGQGDVTVIRSAQNSGYAVGVNLAVERARGDYLLVSNPDVMAFRGALQALLEHLRSNEKCGLAGPKGFLDAQQFFQLPPVMLPTLCELVSESMARTFTSSGRRHSQWRLERALESWTATGAMSTSMISGFCFMMPTALARELGPFDPDYPFYYEDADLCLRLQRLGFTTDFVPRAQMVHFFNRSAGQNQDMAWSRYWVSRRRFYRKRYGVLGQLVYDAFTRFTSSRDGQGHHFAQVDDLGEVASVPVIDVPGSGPYVAEISADPGFVFAAGRLDITRRFKIPTSVWDGLAPAPYYVRFVHRHSKRILRTVAMRKTAPMAAAPPPRPELAAVGAGA